MTHSAHALQAYIHFQIGDYSTAEASIRRALRIDTTNGVYLRLLLACLLAQEKETLASRWLRKLADLEGVDLSSLKAELRKVDFPTDTYTLMQNAFPNAVGWFESTLWDEIEQTQLGEPSKSFIDAEIMVEIKKFRIEKMDARKVPRDFRSLIPIVMMWGIGDDVARGTFVQRATKSQKCQVRQALPDKVRRCINDWLDGFGDGSTMTDEAAAFLYLLLAYEQL